VIAVLLAAPGIAPGGLDVTARIWVDPDVGPGRGNDDGADALQLLGVTNNDTVRVDVAPALAGAAAGDPGPDIGCVTQSSGMRRGDRVVGDLRYGRGGESQTGYCDLALMTASRRRAIPVSVAMAYADCRELELELALSSLCDESMCAV
jgi:hypothetical protein